MSRLIVLSSILILLLGFSMQPVVARDETCTTILTQALSQTADKCSGVGRNEACLGYGSVSVQTQSGFESVSLSDAGDVVDAHAIQSLTSTSGDDWAITVLNLQLNLPADQPEQNVVLLVLGDVQLENGIGAVVQAPTLNITSTGSANVRSGPSTGDAVVGTLSANYVVVANGRNADGTWLRIQLSEDQTGWVFGELVTIDGDVNTLNEVDTSAVVEEEQPPFSSFTFTSSGGEGACVGELPQGIFLQTPDGTGMPDPTHATRFTVNGVNVALGSTVWMENSGEELTVSVLEHYAEIAAPNSYGLVEAGAESLLGFNDVNDTPELIQLRPLTMDDVLQGLLDNLQPPTVNRPVSAPAPASESDAGELSSETGFADEYPLADGFWVYATDETTFSGNCPVRTSAFEPARNFISFDSDEFFLVNEKDEFEAMIFGEDTMVFDHPLANYYITTDVVEIVTTQVVLEKLSPLQATGNITFSINDGVNGCVINTPISLVSCLYDFAYGTTSGNGICPKEINDAMR